MINFVISEANFDYRGRSSLVILRCSRFLFFLSIIIPKKMQKISPISFFEVSPWEAVTDSKR
jgi:hypothetical protein